jgi:hypothetical protein
MEMQTCFDVKAEQACQSGSYTDSAGTCMIYGKDTRRAFAGSCYGANIFPEKAPSGEPERITGPSDIQYLEPGGLWPMFTQTESASSVGIYTLDGSLRPVWLVSSRSGPLNLQVHGDQVYWTTAYAALYRVPLVGGAATLVLDGVSAYAIDDASATLVYTEGRYKDYSVVYERPLAGGTPKELMTAYEIRNLEIVGGLVYVAGSGLDYIPLAGGAHQASTAQGSPICIGETAVYSNFRYARDPQLRVTWTGSGKTKDLGYYGERGIGCDPSHVYAVSLSGELVAFGREDQVPVLLARRPGIVRKVVAAGEWIYFLEGATETGPATLYRLPRPE